MKDFLIAICILCTVTAFAQKREAVQLSNRYNDISKTMSKKMQYLLPEFTKGTVLFKDYKTASAMLNYNMLMEQMQFMQDTNVMEIANVDQVLQVTIGKRMFINYKNKFVEILMGANADVQLGVSRKLRIISHQKEAGYGGNTSLMNVETVTTINGVPADELTGKEELVFQEDKIFYVIVDAKPIIASKKAFVKAFPKCKEEIAKNDKDMDYSKEEQLRGLMMICQP